MEQKLGLFTEVVKTNENSDFPSIYRPMNSYEREVMQMSVENIYIFSFFLQQQYYSWYNNTISVLPTENGISPVLMLRISPNE